jgi:hypothetical protein
MKLVDAATGADVPNGAVQISMAGKPVGQFTYGRLAVPVTLAANRSYYLVSSENVLSDGDHFHEYNGTIRTSADAIMEHAVFWDKTLWRRLGGLNQSVGPVTLRYTTSAK